MKDYAVNVIAKNILSQFDDKSYIGTLVYSIVYYNIDDSEVEKADKYIFTRIIQHRLINMTQGWNFLLHGRMDLRHEFLSWIRRNKYC